MTMINKIRTEIERRMKELDSDWMGTPAAGWAFSELLSFLDTLEEKSEKPMNLDLEKEIASFITQFGWGNTKHLAEKELINCTARHFANIGWNFGYIKGREAAHKPAREVGLPKRFDKQPACDGLDVAANNWICSHKDGEILYVKDAFKAGAAWDRNQMMKEAVEGEVVQDLKGVNRVKSFSKIPEWLHFGDKVRIIIVKED